MDSSLVRPARPPPSPAPPNPPDAASPGFDLPDPRLGTESSKPPASPTEPRLPAAGKLDGAWLPTETVRRWAHGESVSILATSLSFHSVYDFDCQKSAAHTQTVR